MELLSRKHIEKFDYVKTKKNVEDYLEELILIKYKFMNIMPPTTAMKIFNIKVQSSNVNKSSIESYVMLKDEYMSKYQEKLEEIETYLSALSQSEQTFFKGHLINGEVLESFTKQFNCGIEKVDRIKVSAIIKFALLINVAVEK